MDQLAGLPEDVRKVAIDRFRLLQPHLEQNQSLQSIARAAGIPYRTAHRWLAQYRLFGLVGLARKAPDDRGTRRTISTKLQEAIEGLALQKPPLPIAALYGYVGLCYGPPGVGKTLSARSYSRWEKVKESDRWSAGPADGPTLDTVFYTPPIVNAPRIIEAAQPFSRHT
jgi:hypothetical protein